MRGFLLQDWITVRAYAGGSGPTVVPAVAQGADSWVDIGDFEDLVFTLDVREVSSTSFSLAYETSPTRADAAFKAMLPAFRPTVGQRVDRVFSSVAGVPPARFVRWKISCSTAGTYDLTFRIWLAAYAWVC